MANYWKLVSRNDSRARRLADRHYSRRHPGATEFCPPEHNIVLLGLKDDALWVSHRPDPRAGLRLPRLDGYECWDNPYFRNESCERASDMILEAVAITLGYWGDLIPRDRFHSFVDPKKVKPTYQRGKAIYGFCFKKAGFHLHPERTKERNLLRYILTAEQLWEIQPILPCSDQLRLFD